VYLKNRPATVAIEEGFVRDARQIGHWATNELELTVDSGDRVKQAKEWLRRATSAADSVFRVAHAICFAGGFPPAANSNL
jgi:hypothetical protein